MKLRNYKNILKSYLSKVNFALGRNPRIITGIDSSKFIPEQYKTVILISADFELAWAPRYANNITDPINFALTSARTERSNIPKIIELCEEFNIPITWATVGHLFLESCSSKNGVKHPEIPKIKNYEGIYWDFMGEDWFEFDPCSNLIESPEWYAPDLIKMITDSRVNHEIGCHTFSHIDCRDGICDPDLIRAEIRESKRLAKIFNIDLHSFVHPGHTIGNLDVLADEGFNNFRTDSDNTLGYPLKRYPRLWELQQTREFRYYDHWSIEYQIRRYNTIIDRAIKSKTVCVFWFHPSFDPIVIHDIWPKVFKHINLRRKDIWVTTHNEYIEWVEKQQ